MTQVTDIDIALLARAYEATGRVLAAIPDERWDAPSPCAEWTVREVADHLVDALDFFACTVSGTTPGAPTDYDDATRRCMAAFARPEVLAAEHPFPGGVRRGWAIAGISMSESLVHGWDLATGAGVPYEPDADVVAAVAAQPAAPVSADLFGDPVPVPADASPLVALLGRLGRAVR